ncbi:YqgE/AlgH family protein [Oceaniglobus indicus]|uniref:YqgE/AlgH family protein n=1 Tax=Oceaniglobus indicus TaxID=2047749 RepID=UPI000C1A2F41|nr:YqgE/AlgH family protein [Oceaniglobus indicus]
MNPSTETVSEDLIGKLLIAMPGMGDPRFERSVIYLCEHDATSSMGLIVNKPVSELDFTTLLEQLQIEGGPRAADIGVYFGGPVEKARGFVLHSDDYDSAEGTIRINADFALTATTDILGALAQGTGPTRSLFALGYAGWGPGQLMDEIMGNGWLICAADPEIVFAPDAEGKWAAALGSMGVDPRTLSGAAGRA